MEYQVFTDSFLRVIEADKEKLIFLFYKKCAGCVSGFFIGKELSPGGTA